MDGIDDVLLIPIIRICSGRITSVLKNKESYEVYIYQSPIGEFGCNIVCDLIYQPGQEGNYKQGDYVKVMCTFTFGGVDNKIIGRDSTSASYIIGTYNERSDLNLRSENALGENDIDRVRWVNRKSQAGLLATDNGKVTLASGGSIYSLLSPDGYGVNENMKHDVAQNFHRIVSHNPPLYLSREFFGMYSGINESQKSLNFSDDDYFINYRRFVTQTRSPDNWVSTCEGSWDPFVGPNNDNLSVKKSKETLFTKIVNHDNTRLTIEAGEPGDGFLNIRLDNIILSEKKMTLTEGATPSVVGNLFKFKLSEDGEIDIRSAGKGIPGSNFDAFHMSVDKEGNLKIHSAKSITISHGDNDEEINSIRMDSSKGIDIKAKNGVRVNGLPLVNDRFLKWMSKYQTSLCQVTTIGGPAPIHPIALPEFNTGFNIIDDLGGFTTKNKGIPATGIISDIDSFRSA